MELLFLEEKRGNLRLTFQNSQKKAQVALSWLESEEKNFLNSERKSAASHLEKRDHCDL